MKTIGMTREQILKAIEAYQQQNEKLKGPKVIKCKVAGHRWIKSTVRRAKTKRLHDTAMKDIS